jgi:hypothetical protein
VAEVQAHSNAITKLDKTGNDMIQHGHYEKETIRVSYTHNSSALPNQSGKMY